MLQTGRTLLNSRPQGVRIASSKLKTAGCIKLLGLPMTPTWSAEAPPPSSGGCWIVKPDDGIGCVGARLVRGDGPLADALAELRGTGEWVVQPYIPGQAASLSLLVGDDVVYLLGCNRQRVALLDDGFVLLGCEVNGLQGDRALYARLGRSVAEAIPGLWGYVGIDLVVTDRGPMILEVNARLTTSYVGLSRSPGANVAEMVIGLAQAVHLPPATCLHPHSVDVDLEQYHDA